MRAVPLWLARPKSSLQGHRSNRHCQGQAPGLPDPTHRGSVPPGLTSTQGACPGRSWVLGFRKCGGLQPSGKPTSLLLAARSFQKQGRLCAGGWEEGTLERSWRLALSLPFSHHAPALGNGQPWAWGLWGASVMSHWVQEENQPSPQTSGAVICRCTQGLVCGFLILLSVEGTFARKAGRFWLLSPQHPLC